MIDQAVRYDRWKAPADDGGLLLWPPANQLVDDAGANHQLLSTAHGARLQNVPLSDVRSAMRTFVGHTDPNQLLIATGHQTELHHPGVWAKNALIDAAAVRVSGSAYHFAVDTDQPKHLSLRWPGVSEPLSDEPLTAAWMSAVSPPTPAHLASLTTTFEQASGGWGFVPMLGEFLDSLRRSSLESPNLAVSLSNAIHSLDWKLGLRHHLLLVSPLCSCQPYLLFVHHVLARADAFAADYNASLADYRKENRIRSVGRPMPDLRNDAVATEVPFWLDCFADGSRSRASVTRDRDGKFALTLPTGDTFSFDPTLDGWEAARLFGDWLRRTRHVLAPRALTLTAVLRLLVADQFVHGIGGGQYDQVLDRLIIRHLHLQPPRFAVTTATLYFPSALDHPRVCLPCIVQEGRKLKHSVLGSEKLEMVAQIDALPRRSHDRSALFSAMHAKLAQAWSSGPMRAWESRAKETTERSKQERAVYDRELFYALQPQSRLQMLIGRYRSAFE